MATWRSIDPLSRTGRGRWGQPVLKQLDHPLELGNGEHGSSTWSRSVRALGPAHLDSTEVAVRRDVWVRAEVNVLQHRQLATSQSVGVANLDRNGVAERWQPALGAGGVLLVDNVVGRVEQRFHLIERQRTPAWWNGVVGRVPWRNVTRVSLI
jgi:hypothetical protein